VLRRELHHRHTGVPVGFRPRGTEVTRLEGFTDAVFAFALTLLVVSLEVPRTFHELIQTMQGFFAFAVCFALLMQIWFKHYGFFRRYGLQDAETRILNAILLFIVLFYVYPLKFLWSHFGRGGPSFDVSEGRLLLVIYGLGGAAVFGVFVLLYRHAWSLRDEIDLDAIERYDTKAALRENALMTAVPLLSVAMAATLPGNLVGLAGWLYMGYAPLLTWNGIREKRGRVALLAARSAGSEKKSFGE
jgi:uncharacterized membrane protein